MNPTNRDPFEKLADFTFEIELCTSAAVIIKTAEKNGLDDVNQWITEEGLQYNLDNGREIAFIAISRKVSQQEGDNNEQEPFSDIPIGVIIGGFEEEGRMWIELLVVAPQFRRRGIGTALIDSLVKICKEKKLRALFVDVDDDNYKALSFYKVYGFKDAGIIKQYYYDNSDAIILNLLF